MFGLVCSHWLFASRLGFVLASLCSRFVAFSLRFVIGSVVFASICSRFSLFSVRFVLVSFHVVAPLLADGANEVVAGVWVTIVVVVWVLCFSVSLRYVFAAFCYRFVPLHRSLRDRGVNGRRSGP